MRLGNQQPRIRLEPDRAYTDGADAGYFAASYGLKPDQWQQTILDCWLGRSGNDKFTATTCGLALPRQNGKNAVIEMRELYGLVMNHEAILHTAHEVKTARKAFLRLASFFEDTIRYPELAALVKVIRRTNGQECIQLNDTIDESGNVISGGLIEFSARSRGAARGFTADVLVLDECQELTDEQLEALMYTLSASHNDNRQMIYTGTPPSPLSPATVFPRIRQHVIDGDSAPGTAWHEWSIEELPKTDDEAVLMSLAYDTNPAMGIRITEDFTRTEMKTSNLEGFARERLGWWRSVGAIVPLINPNDWTRCATETPPDGDDVRIVFGVRISADNRYCALSACVAPKVGTPHVELVKYDDITDTGINGIAEYIASQLEKVGGVVVDGLGAGDALINKLSALKAPLKAVKRARVSDVIAANAKFANAVKSMEVTHYDQEQMNISAATSVKRDIGSSGGFGFAGTCCEPIESAALALYALDVIKRKPGRKMRIL